MENNKVIGVVQVLEHLKNGLTRDDIAVKYGITKGECKLLFKHKDLIGKKTIKKPTFTIVADETAEMGVENKEVKVEGNTSFTVVDDTEGNPVVNNETKEKSDPAIEASKATWGD